MTKDIGFGIVGLGMGANRAKTAANTDGANLVCVCDLQEEKAKSLSEKLGCDYHTDLDDVLQRDDVDVVGVMTPSGTHADVGIQALEAGKHVFTTKPMDISLEKCDAFISAAEDADKILAVDFQCRYDDDNRRLHQFISQEGLGGLILGDLRMKWFRDQDYYEGGFPRGWKKDVQYEGGSAANQGVHYIDLLQWFCGPVKEVYGRSGTMGHDISTEDLSLAILTFQNGAWGMIETTTCSYPSLGTRIEITGEKGTAIWDREGSSLEIKEKPDFKIEDISIEPGPDNIIEDMMGAINEGKPVAVPGEEGKKSVKIFNAIYESSSKGKKVEIK